MASFLCWAILALCSMVSCVIRFVLMRFGGGGSVVSCCCGGNGIGVCIDMSIGGHGCMVIPEGCEGGLVRSCMGVMVCQ